MCTTSLNHLWDPAHIGLLPRMQITRLFNAKGVFSYYPSHHLQMCNSDMLFFKWPWLS